MTPNIRKVFRNKDVVNYVEKMLGTKRATGFGTDIPVYLDKISFNSRAGLEAFPEKAEENKQTGKSVRQ